MIVERLAQALGMWGDFSGATTLEPGPGGYRVWTPGGPEVAQREPASVDEGTALIFLLALASGLRLDVGRCPACVERGCRYVLTEDEEGRVRVTSGKGWTSAGGMASDIIAEIDHLAGVVMRLCRCPKCKGTGKQPGPPQPTGRRILGAEAIFEAIGRGGQPVRDALAVHADRLQADGDPLGELIAAWLRGECQVCEGGKIHEWAHATPQGWEPVAPGLAGPALPWLGKATNTWRIAGFGKACRKMQCCHGHGTVLGALWPALEALAAEWCERLKGATTS